jgi:hypothetical protein
MHFVRSMPIRIHLSLYSPVRVVASAQAPIWKLSPSVIARRSANLAGNDSIAPMGPSRLRLSKPVIAAVEGHAVAGGMELALWADMRVVGEGATFGIYCRRFGVPLIDLGTIRLPRLIGHSVPWT